MVKTPISDARKATAKRYYEKNKEQIAMKLKTKRDDAISIVKKKRQMVYNLDVAQAYLQSTNVSEVTKKNNHKNIQLVFKALMYEHECLFLYLMRVSMVSVLKKFNEMTKERGKENSTTYSLPSQLKLVEVLLNVCKYIHGTLNDTTIVKLFEKKTIQMSSLCSDMKIEIEKNTIEKNKLKTYITFDEMKSRILQKFGPTSKEHVITLLYEACHGRDNFYLYIVPDLRTANKDKTRNYFILDAEKERSTIGLFTHKTSTEFSNILKELSKEASDLIREYIQTHALTELLFPEHKNKKLGVFIKQMLIAIDITEATGSSTIRKIISNSFDDKNSSANVQRRNARSMFHTEHTHAVSYIYGGK
jgi:hypothetical protein